MYVMFVCDIMIFFTHNIRPFPLSNAHCNSGTAFKTNEGTKKVTIPAGGINAGSIFSYESGSSAGTATHQLGDKWVSEAGSFALSGASDAIFVYCLDDGPDGTPSVPVFLTARPTAWMGGLSQIPMNPHFQLDSRPCHPTSLQRLS